MCSDVCKSCGKKYDRIGTHWSRSSCDYPKLSNFQHEVVAGVLMGDGYINDNNKNPRLQVNMISKEYLRYLDEIFPVVGTGVSLKRTGKENASLSRQSDFFSTVNEEEYNDQYRWQTLTNPAFDEYKGWYDSGEKVFPDNVNLTPTTLKHWYCCDGSLCKRGSYYRMKIAISNEFDNKDKIRTLFTDSGLPEPKFVSGKDIRWNKQESREIIDYMGQPLPDFKYKWP